MLLAALALLAGGEAAAAIKPALLAADARQPIRTPAFSEDDLVLFAVELDALTLTDSLGAYGDPADPYLPLAEVARMLDLDIDVAPADRRLTGRIGEGARGLIIDLDSATARLGGMPISLSSDDIAVTPTDIFVRASALSRILPAKFAVDSEALAIRIVPSEALPIQARLERLARARSAGRQTETGDAITRIASGYALFTPPAFDLIAESGRTSRAGRISKRFDARAAGDLLYTGFQAYIGSDDDGTPTQARVLLERRSRDGRLLGPLRATRVSGGDVFTPSLSLGPRSVAGRGVSFTTAPLEQVSVFDTIDLRGELPIGVDVELYINDVLQSGQRVPMQGRYEFLQVPLVHGINVMRIVSYGTRGQRSEQVRVINVGGGQLKKGQTTVEFGLVEQDRPVFAISDRDAAVGDASFGDLRIAGNLSYGLSEAITLIAGAAIYPTPSGRRLQLVTGGVRTSLLGLAVRGDAALDQRGGKALGLGFAGQPLNVSTVFEHFEYRGSFVDENQSLGSAGQPLVRHTNLTLDFTMPSVGGKVIPVTLRASRDALADGGSSLAVAARTSATFGTILLSTGVDYQRRSAPGAGTTQALGGIVSASTFVDYKWQLRGTLDYELLTGMRLRSLAVTADRNVSDRAALRFGIGHLFEKPSSTSLQVGANLRLPWGEVAVTGDYDVPGDNWSVGLRLAFGLAFDTSRRAYRVTPPGPATGGSATFRSFVDSNGNGRFDGGEAPVANVNVEGGDRHTVTDADGRAFIVGLGTAPTSRLQVGADKIENFYVATPPGTIEFSPRPGQVLQIDYPLTPTGEVLTRLTFARNGERLGLSAVRVRLVRDQAEDLISTTEFDGTAVFNEVPAGTYRLELDPEQARSI